MELTGPWKTISRARKLRQEMSLPERLLWNALRKKQAGLRFRRQHPAGPFILDFYRISAKDVVNELDAVVRFIVNEARAPSASLRSAPPPVGEE
jgi:very-short-patch-repair endonuclease